jgi:hypothetical protein
MYERVSVVCGQLLLLLLLAVRRMQVRWSSGAGCTNEEQDEGDDEELGPSRHGAIGLVQALHCVVEPVRRHLWNEETKQLYINLLIYYHKATKQ